MAEPWEFCSQSVGKAALLHDCHPPFEKIDSLFKDMVDFSQSMSFLLLI